MSIPIWVRRTAWLPALAVLLLVGCGESDPEPISNAKDGRGKAQTARSKLNVSQNIWFEVDKETGQRRVLVSAEVCLRSGPLEQFLTRKGQKEHESILAADIDARKLHETLLLAKAKPGEPAQFVPRFRPAKGSAIRVSVIYDDGSGTPKTVPAGSWMKIPKTGKPLESDWVFAGSMLVDNPFDPTAPKRYLANDGDVICVANFESALLDLPFQSSKGDEELSFEAWTERIPEVGTKVVVALEPVAAKK